MPAPALRLLPCAAAAVLGLGVAPPARAAGFHLVKADLIGGVAEGGHVEAGLGLSLYSEELAGWITAGDPAADGGRLVKEWWFESRPRGPVMGELPPSMVALGFEEPERLGRARVLIPVRSWRLGGDATTGRWLEWDWSGHGMLNAAGFWGSNPRLALFGPTAGLGANLTWWQGWRGADQPLVSTGKLTVEAGWIAGIVLDQAFYAQARLLTHVDAFGVHQANLGLLGLAGFSLGARGRPLGIEVSGRLDRGDDTVDLATRSTWSLRLALCYRLLPGVRQRADPPV